MRIEYFTIVLLSSIGFSQVVVPPISRGALQNALLMERKGDIEEARKVYETILASKPTNRQAYTQLLNIYQRLGEYTLAVELINNWLRYSPHDLQQRVELGKMYYLGGNINKATEIWENFIAQYGQNPSTFRILIHTYNIMGLSEKMLETVLLGRERFNDPSFMALDLGNYYQSRQRIDEAVSEFLVYLEVNPKQFKLVNKKILMMCNDNENIEIIENRLNNSTDNSPIIVHKLLSSLYFKTGRYRQSLDHQLLINDGLDVRLNRLIQFANSLRKEHQFDLSVSTYQIILSDLRSSPIFINSKKLGNVLLGLGQVYEDQIQPHVFNNSLILNEINNAFFNTQFNLKTTISTEALEQAMSMYNTILIDLQSTSFSPEAHFRLGEIQFKILQDMDGARTAYTTALSMNPHQELAFKIHSSLIDILVAEGKIEEGEIYLQGLPFSLKNKYQNEMAVKSIQMKLYSGKIDSTLAILDNILVNIAPTDNQFNDFMELQSIINRYYTDVDEKNKRAFQQYLVGELLLRQNNLSEAESVFSTILKNHNSAPISEIASIREIFIQLQLNQIDKAMESLNWLLRSDTGDKGLVLAGEIFQYIRYDRQTALNYYEQFLQKYPYSFLYEPVRQRVRNLKAELKS